MTDEQLELLYGRLVERELAELDRLTLAVVASGSIVMGGQAAFDSWKAARTGEAAKVGTAQRQSLLRLASHFPDAVKGI